MRKIIFLLFISSVTFAQVEYSQRNEMGQFLPRFYIDLASYKSQETDKSKIDVFIKVPYSNLQFLKSGNNYAAKYSIVVSIYDDDDVLKFEKLWNEKIETTDFKQTSSYTSFNVSYKS
ncbi:MAG: hypothetical protein KDC67_13195, partial [Ignavibacteriae bacterium]|nr:hypothetical protein [Ignavibacteriota bacterium]